ncbi:MAG: Asp23/Gls24 family envelope stress response protein [Acidimicrobiales bacterium]
MTESSTGAPGGETTATSRTAPSTPSGAVATPQRAATLKTENGTTVIADGVVAKIAGLATREIPGVFDMGKGMGRTFGALRSRVPGSSGQPSITQGVAVEVGERQAAIDLDVVTYYGQSIVEVTEAIRRNVIDRVESMTSLEVIEVNIAVGDLHIEGEPEESKEPRVQ